MFSTQVLISILFGGHGLINTNCLHEERCFVCANNFSIWDNTYRNMSELGVNIIAKALTLFCSEELHLALTRILMTPAWPYRAEVCRGVSPY